MKWHNTNNLVVKRTGSELDMEYEFLTPELALQKGWQWKTDV